MTKIWVTGESLIDFVPIETTDGPAFRPLCGGSNFNVAKAAAKQGASVAYCGAISTDMFGDQLVTDLLASNVDISQAERVPRPTTLAFVKFVDKNARYAFFNENSATQMTDHTGTQLASGPGDILHAGSISLIDNPGGANIAEFAYHHAQSMFLSVDPNARPNIISDLPSWRQRIEQLVSRAGLVKLSDEDLAVLAPGIEPQNYAQQLINAGTSMVVITSGKDGAIAVTRSGFATVRANPTGLVDTVGAGDTVTGTLLCQLADKGLTQNETLSGLGSSGLEILLQRAMVAAWLNCQTSGCNPPTHQEIDQALG